MVATRAGSLSPWTVPEHGGGRVLRVTGTDPAGSPALHRPPACTAVPHALCSLLAPHQGGLSPSDVPWHQLRSVPMRPALSRHRPVDFVASSPATVPSGAGAGEWPSIGGSEPLLVHGSAAGDPCPSCYLPARSLSTQTLMHACTWAHRGRMRVSWVLGCSQRAWPSVPPCMSESHTGACRHPHVVLCAPAWALSGSGLQPPHPPSHVLGMTSPAACCSSHTPSWPPDQHAPPSPRPGVPGGLAGPGDIVFPYLGTVGWGLGLLESPGSVGRCVAVESAHQTPCHR